MSDLKSEVFGILCMFIVGFVCGSFVQQKVTDYQIEQRMSE